jgi:hypothetical protein
MASTRSETVVTVTAPQRNPGPIREGTRMRIHQPMLPATAGIKRRAEEAT